MPVRILIVDNYDSFTYNLVHLVEKVSDAEVTVRKNDAFDIYDVAGYDKIILSPGPGLPPESGKMPALLEQYAATKPILGVCLGLQAIGLRFGMKLRNLDTVLHGRALPVRVVHEDVLYQGCPKQFTAGRYHSWVLDKSTLPEELIITALGDDDNIMSVSHRTLDVRGVQFHPESILSEYGDQIMRNWIGQ